MKLFSSLASALLLGACSSSPTHLALAPQRDAARATVHVEVAIDFGGERAPIERAVDVPVGSSVVDATRAAARVDQDWLCCSPRDVWAIEGVEPDPRNDRYWFWMLDGRAGPDAPADHVVQDGDAIRWIYNESKRPRYSGDGPQPRIVSLLPAAAEIVTAVGGEDWLVALSHLCAQPAGKQLPRVVSTVLDSDVWDMQRIDRELHERAERGEKLYALDDERITSLKPTLVLSQGVCPVCAVSAEDAASHSKDACAELLVLTPHSLADVAENIRRVGAAIGRGGAGKVAARAFERRIERVRALRPLEPRPDVVVIEWFEPLWVSGEWSAEMVEAAGGRAVLAGPSDSSRRANWDELAAADPDAIVLAACSMSIERTKRELRLLTERAEWSKLRAVRDSRVFVVDGNAHFSTPGPGLARGAEVVADALRSGSEASGEGWQRVAARE